MNVLRQEVLADVAEGCDTWEKARVVIRLTDRMTKKQLGRGLPKITAADWHKARSIYLRDNDMPPLERLRTEIKLLDLEACLQFDDPEVIQIFAKVCGMENTDRVRLDAVELVQVETLGELWAVVDSGAAAAGEAHCYYVTSADRLDSDGNPLPERWRKIALRATESPRVAAKGLCRDQKTGAYLTEGAEARALETRRALLARRTQGVRLLPWEQKAADRERKRTKAKALTLMACCDSWALADRLLSELKALGMADGVTVLRKEWEAEHAKRKDDR